MKISAVLVPLCAVCLGACALPEWTERVTVGLPSVPAAWESVLGTPHWRLEWKDDDGLSRSTVLSPGTDGIVMEWAAGTPSFVLAHPYWPGFSIFPGVFRPAGAVYPTDRRDDRMRLTWEGGVAAWFYRELDRAEGEARTRPERFDWPRFYALLRGPDLSPAVVADPWRVDWTVVAGKTRASGFDRRRISARSAQTVELCVPADGPWIHSSPFIESFDWMAGKLVELSVCEAGTAYVSSAGLLRCSISAVAFFPW